MLAWLLYFCFLFTAPQSIPPLMPDADDTGCGYRLADNWYDWHRISLGGVGLRREVQECILIDASWRKRAWEDLYDAHVAGRAHNFEQPKLEFHLARLRCAIGWPDFYAGRMPSPVGPHR